MLTLSALIFDGVMDKFPKLKFGAIELGASWLPGWMRLMDSSVKAFARHEERLRKLSALPSEIVRRQVRVTPYPSDDAGWIIANSGPEICMYSSDYPHPEGGRDPLTHFRASLDGANVDRKSRDGFFRDNFVDMMGEGLAADLRYPEHRTAA
jgi:predicted TIM-barrel fold metal-dependent hydrolase